MGGWRRGPPARVITRPGEEPDRTRHSYPYYRCRILPFGQADLLCCSAFAVYEYSFIRCASHINL